MEAIGGGGGGLDGLDSLIQRRGLISPGGGPRVVIHSIIEFKS